MPLTQRDLTLVEVAELRRFTPRYLRELVRRHGIPVLRSGRLIRFDALALNALEEALRCRSGLSAGNQPGPVAGQRVQRRAQSNNPKLAEEEAATLEAEILRGQWHGEKRGARSFSEAALSYLEVFDRSESTKARVRRLTLALGTTRLADI